MQSILATAGSVVGWLGVFVCAVAGTAKLLGAYYFLGFEALSVFVGGVGLMSAGILAKLEARDWPGKSAS